MHIVPYRRLFVLAVLALSPSAACAGSSDLEPSVAAAHGASPLALDLDPASTTTSGLSSGAFMAVQFEVAFSASTRGVAAFAGGPYACARGSVVEALTTCMSSSAALDPAPFVALTRARAEAGAIDDVANLSSHRVFLFGGDADTTVRPSVMDALRGYYGVFVEDAAVAFVRRRPATAHTMPTETYGGACEVTAPPYVGRCGYDGAGAALEHLYGPLAPRAAAPSGTFHELSQRDAIAAPATHSLAESAYVYVPAACATGARCRVHVAFHGCKQSSSEVGDAFYKHAGYNEWADTNRIVVVYPQTIATGKNPNGCWDWWGYDSPDYATKAGPQMTMVKHLVDRLLSGEVGPTKDGGTNDEGGVVDGGHGGDASDASVVEQGATCVTASNADHVVAGRARALFGLAYAVGSGQLLGLDAAWQYATLRRASGNAWVLGVCLR